MASEFDLIHRYFQRPAASAVLGVGDDCALLPPRPGMLLAVSTDMLVEGRHFLPGADAEKLGAKSLAVNLSDLAAMGARPLWFTLALSLPDADESWLAGFAAGIGALAARCGIALVGGDTTRGPLSITIQVHGAAAPGRALRRDGARAGDSLWVTGHPGLAALGLQRLQTGVAEDDPVCAAFVWPEPRLAFGRSLGGLATAAIDVSDGLLADAGHIAERSGLGIEIDATLLPLEGALGTIPRSEALALCLTGGDDYELCFTAPALASAAITALAAAQGLSCRRIGTVVPGAGARCAGVDTTGTGYQHFGGSADG